MCLGPARRGAREEDRDLIADGEVLTIRVLPERETAHVLAHHIDEVEGTDVHAFAGLRQVAPVRDEAAHGAQ